MNERRENMRSSLGESLKNLMWVKTRRSRMSAVAFVLSVVVSLNVFFALRQPGLTLAGDASCGILEHSHDDACFVQECICEVPEDVHVHDDSCYEIRVVEAMENRRLVCQLTEQPHVHNDGCYSRAAAESTQQNVLICNHAEEHIHNDDCYRIEKIPDIENKVLICGYDLEPDSDSDADTQMIIVQDIDDPELACDQGAEFHEHSENCYRVEIIEGWEETILTCDIVSEPHNDSCYQMIESQSSEEAVLVCDLVSEPHEHSENCYETEIIEQGEERILICGIEECLHMHDDTCYEQNMICTLPEHIHTLECYSDDTADVETQADWKEMFEKYPYSGNLRKDLAGIARSQVGYSESTRNFETDDDGMRRGYTRYGAWYGAPYEDWSAMFVSFCLHYAGADADECPGNTGASSMAKKWDKLGKYTAEEEYLPSEGDLVFFKDNTVGIVSDVFNSTFNAICGDVDNTVQCVSMPLKDSSIRGWGITVGTLQEANATSEPTAEPAPTPTAEPTAEPTVEPTAEPNAEPAAEATLEPTVEPTAEPAAEATLEPMAENTPEATAEPDTVAGIPDVSNGPVVSIFAGREEQQRMMRFAMRNTPAATSLLPYLNANGGSYFITLLDDNDQELEKDDNGKFIVYPETNYKLTLGFNSPKGFLPGTYQYQIQDGLLVKGGEGNFVLNDGTNVGSWVVSDDGLITMSFNEQINNRTDITISVALAVEFTEQEGTLDFDGKISVTIQKPPEDLKKTEVIKWGIQGNPDTDGKNDPDRIYWNVNIVGYEGSNIPGTVLTDRIVNGEWIGVQKYTQKDMAKGLRFGASDPSYKWHSWTVYPGDPNLEWTEEGWTYAMPETIVCADCGNLALGNEGWIYYIDYSSTPDPTGYAGALYYMNRITVDGQHADGGSNFSHGEAHGEIEKTGAFVADASGGAFQWELQVTIPGRKEGDRAMGNWYFMDWMYVLDEYGSRHAYAENDAISAVVTANNNGNTVRVPNVLDATEYSRFAWSNAWSANADGVDYGRQIALLSRCECTEETCFNWNNGCPQYWFETPSTEWITNGYCQCWTETEPTTFTFAYETDDVSVLEAYSGLDYQLQNVATLYYKPNKDADFSEASNTYDSVPIPSLFEKKLTDKYDGYIANYVITLNEAMVPLTNGAPLNIRDEMTDTLAYISGSLVITTEDANGKTTTLQQDVDYTVHYDGTGTQTNNAGVPVHVMDIVILHPHPVKYTLDYDTMLIIPPGTTQAIKYSNSAQITLWGGEITGGSVEKVYAEINIAAKTYRMEMYKTAAGTGIPLSGAIFGLYNAHDGLIATEETDANGELAFETNIIQGIILREHELYYLKEEKAPPGYRLDDTKYWFCFCDNTNSSCATCNQVIAGTDAMRIPFEQIEKVHVENEILSYNLPGTGGPGVYPLIYASAVCVIIPLVYGFIRRRKREGRGVN